MSLAEALPDPVTIEGVIDEPLFAELVSVGGVFFVGGFALVTSCDVFPVIGLRGCAFFSFFIFAWLVVLLVEVVNFFPTASPQSGIANGLHVVGLFVAAQLTEMRR